jgi:hypothetical protein
MTLTQLGKATKSLHSPHYDHHSDAAVGAAMQKKFPGLYDGYGDMDKGTIPETPRTLALQLEQLESGIRRVVFIARGSKLKINPADYGARKLVLPPGEFIYDPKAIKPKEIMAAVKDHQLSEILGSADQGYGTPDKTELRGDPQAVVSRTEDGETVQGALTDPEHVDTAVHAARAVTPKGGSISLESPEQEIQHRMGVAPKMLPDPSPSAAPLKYKRPTRGAKWPKPQGAI